MSPRIAFRLLVMMGCLGGIAYGATRITDLPDGPRQLMARVGKWLQTHAGPASSERNQLPAGTEARAASAVDYGTPPIASPQGTPPLPAEVMVESPDAVRSAAVSPAVVAESSRSPLEGLAAQLRELGATHYSVEEWGEEGQMVRCECVVSLGRLSGLGQHFEAVAATGEEALHRIIAQIAASRSR